MTELICDLRVAHERLGSYGRILELREHMLRGEWEREMLVGAVRASRTAGAVARPH